MSELSLVSRSYWLRLWARGLGAACIVAWGGEAEAQPLSDAFMTDTPRALNHYSGHTPSAASDGTNTLVLFEDGGSIHAARLDAAGNPLDIEWLPVQPRSAEGDLNYYYPGLGFGGGRYLAAWSGTTLAARLIEPDGTLLPVFELASNGMYPSIAWNGEAFVVACMDITDEGRDTVVAFVDIDGNVLSRTAVSNSGETSWPSVAAGKSLSVVAWENAPGTSVGEIHAARVGHDGSVLDPGGVRIAFTDQDRFVHVATSGESFLVAWNEMTAPSGVMGTVIGEDGARSDTVRLNAAASSGRDFNVGFDGEQFAAVWVDDSVYPNTLWGTNVSLAGAVAEPVEIPSREPRANDPPHLLWNGEHYLLSYVAEGIVGNTLSGQLESDQRELALSFVPASQDSAQSCFDGTHYVLAWTEHRGVGPLQSVRNTQIGQNAQVLDAETLQLGTTGEEYSRSVALACAGGDSSLTVWSDSSTETLYAQVRHADGGLGEVLTVATGAIAGPNLASNGDSYLVTFLTSIAEGQSAMSAQLLELDGTPRGERFELRETGVFARGSLSAIGSGYLWYYDDNENTYLQPITATGQVPEPILLDSGRTSVFSASNETQGLITYGKLTADGETREQVLRFVAQDDWQTADIPLGIATSYVKPAWDGSRFVMVTQDDSYGADLYAVDESGALSVLQEDLVPEDSYVYGLSSNAAGQLLLSYLSYVGELQTSTRIFNRVIGDLVSVDLSTRVTPVPTEQPPNGQPEPEPPSEEPPLDAPADDTAPIDVDAGPSNEGTDVAVDAPPVNAPPAEAPPAAEATSNANQAPSAPKPMDTAEGETATNATPDGSTASEAEVAQQANADDGGCRIALAKPRSLASAWFSVGAFALLAIARRRNRRAL